MTQWQRHPAYTNYEVSPQGLVRHVARGRLRKTRSDRYGYLRINILHDGKHKTVHVHTLVAETFIGLAGPGQTVNHKDGNKNNNADWNLEWVSSAENTSHSFRTGQRANRRCHPVIINGARFFSKREVERALGVPRHTLPRGPHIELDRKAYPA